MKKKQTNGYNWRFSNVGGVTRVNIDNGSDIAHLSELDQKLWTVLSCPVKGLELDETTLALMDSDADGKIRVNEVIDASKWLCQVLKNPDFLLKQTGTLPLSEINSDTEAGAKVLASAVEILKNLGLEGDTISIENTADSMAIFAKTRFNGDGIITEGSTDDDKQKEAIKAIIATMGSVTDRSGDAGVDTDRINNFYTALTEYAAWQKAAADDKAIMTYGADTEAALAAFKALENKVADFFMRCKLVAFDAASATSLDMSAARVEAISTADLTTCNEQIASYPLARVNDKGELPIDGTGINPAWQTVFETLRTIVLSKEFAKSKTITEAEWKSLAGKFAAYEAWKASKKGNAVESLGFAAIEQLLADNAKDALLELVEQDKALETEAAEIRSVDKLLHLCRDFYELLKNFVTFSDFYNVDRNVKADFQAGTLYIDQRSCDLCIKVSDMAKHNAMASFSGMYLLYCDCTSKISGQKMTIVAAMTNGDVDNLMVGKNAIFYDRNGLDWDATVTKIIENPISIRQAFWSPYRKFARFIEEQVNKFASSRDNEMTSNATSKISETGSEMTEAASADTSATKAAPAPFDIAKFCGIFAAIGMAIGYIGGFLVSCLTGFISLTWWQMPLALIGLMLLISGPSMIMAWLKLRKRSLSPVLNANGWAVNAHTFVNIRFGATLTQNAKFPKVTLKDPFAEKKVPVWRKILYTIIVICGIGAGLYFTGNLACIGMPYGEEEQEIVLDENTEPEVIEEIIIIEETPAAE